MENRFTLQGEHRTKAWSGVVYRADNKVQHDGSKAEILKVGYT
jgi:hypothetical protein